MAKTTKKSKTSKNQLTLHGLVGSLSYWGSAARLMLVGMLVLIAFALNVTVISSSDFVNQEVLVLLYSLGILFVMDSAYVMIARSAPLNDRADRWVIMLADLLIASFFVIPSFFYVGDVYSTTLRIISPVIMLMILSVRVLLGLLFSKRGK